MNKYLLIISLLLNITTPTLSSKHFFRVYLKDKSESEYATNKPEEFLTERALKRRTIQDISITESDLPIPKNYQEEIKKRNFDIIARSKWLNTLAVSCKDSAEIETLKQIPFVKEVVWIGKSDSTKIEKTKSAIKLAYPKNKTKGYYGYATDQIYTVNGQKLHEKGYWGSGKEIAIIDAGFTNLKNILYLDNIQVKGIKDFVADGSDILTTSEHGISVLSAMATNQPNTLIGSAPKSSYWLLRSEDGKSEYPIEEDYWVTAIEYADSVGVDIVNTSLGYSEFDLPAKSYTDKDLDGNTSLMSKGAQIASEKGILVVVSAGNEGYTEWKKITIPADARNVLTVGSMSKDSIISNFSSTGPTFDGRIKPEIVAMGEDINLLDSRSEVIVTNGTSFAAPIIAGLAACLWEAYPSLTNDELINILISSSNRYEDPGKKYGYGVPDMGFAMTLANDITTGIEEDLPLEEVKRQFRFTSDSIGQITIKRTIISNEEDPYNIRIYTIDGRLVINEKVDRHEKSFNLNKTERGIYIIHLTGNKVQESKKLSF